MPSTAPGADPGPAVADRRKRSVAVEMRLGVVEFTETDERLDRVDPRIADRRPVPCLQLPLRQGSKGRDCSLEVVSHEFCVTQRCSPGDRLDLIRDGARELDCAMCGRTRLIQEANVRLQERRCAFDHSGELDLSCLLRVIPCDGSVLPCPPQPAGVPLRLHEAQMRPLQGVLVSALGGCFEKLLEHLASEPYLVDLGGSRRKDESRALNKQQRLGEIRLEPHAALEKPWRDLQRPALDETDTSECNRQGPRIMRALRAAQPNPSLPEGRGDIAEQPPGDGQEPVDVSAAGVVACDIDQCLFAQSSTIEQPFTPDERLQV